MNDPVFSVIPYRPLSERRKVELEAILRESNSLLRDYAKLIPKIRRTKILAGLARGVVVFAGVSIPPEHADLILRTKKVEMEVLGGYSRLIKKILGRWPRENNAISEEDLASEAIAASLVAVAHFTKENIRFGTFLGKCLSYHLSRVFDKSTGASSNAMKLRRRYERLRNREGATFDEIVHEMKISDRQVRMLQASLAWTFRHSDMKCDTTSEHSPKDLEAVDPADLTPMPSEESETLRSKLKLMDLSNLEKIVLEAVMSSPNGTLGFAKHCKNAINPSTGRPYTRAALSWAWKNLKRKIGESFPEAA